MASENETVEAIIQDMRAERYAVSGMPDLHMRDYAYRIESAWRREKAELQLALDAEKARHTDDYKDERIRAQDEEIKTLKSEMKPRRNCDAVSDFHDAKRKFNRVCTNGHANFFRRMCHWLLAPVAEGGDQDGNR